MKSLVFRMFSKQHVLYFIVLILMKIVSGKRNFSECTTYQHYANVYVPQIPLNSLTNNVKDDSEIFKGTFYISPEYMGRNWICFKPIGKYAVGEEYQVVVTETLITVGLVGKSICRKDFFDEQLTSWSQINIVIKKDGSIKVFTEIEDLLECNIDQIVEDPPQFLELKGDNSEEENFRAFYDCTYKELN